MVPLDLFLLQQSALYRELCSDGRTSQRIDQSWYAIPYAFEARLRKVHERFDELVDAIQETREELDRLSDTVDTSGGSWPKILEESKETITSILGFSANVKLLLSMHLCTLEGYSSRCVRAAIDLFDGRHPNQQATALEAMEAALASTMITQTAAFLQPLIQVVNFIAQTLSILQNPAYGRLLERKLAKPDPLHISADPFPPFTASTNPEEPQNCIVCWHEMRSLTKTDSPDPADLFPGSVETVCCHGFVRLRCGHSFGIICIALAFEEDVSFRRRRCPLCRAPVLLFDGIQDDEDLHELEAVELVSQGPEFV